MEYLLDCTSEDTASRSLSNIFSCDQSFIEEEFKPNLLKEYYSQNNDMIDFSKYLYQIFSKIFPNHKEPTHIVAFHGTRTTGEENFKSGLLSLNDSINFVWDILISKAPNEKIKDKIKEMRWSKNTNLKPCHQYYDRVSNLSLGGPLGFTAKEALIPTENTDNKDFLDIPEIMQDILLGLPYCYDDLSKHYKSILPPMIVKFKYSISKQHMHFLETVLAYLYFKKKNMPLGNSAIYIVDNSGKSISPTNILSVEKIVL